MNAIDYLRVVVEDPAAPPVVVEGDIEALRRIRAMRSRRDRAGGS